MGAVQFVPTTRDKAPETPADSEWAVGKEEKMPKKAGDFPSGEIPTTGGIGPWSMSPSKLVRISSHPAAPLPRNHGGSGT